MNEEFISVNGNKIRYLKDGSSKKTLVLIHGLGASAERWEYVIPQFSKNYTVIVPDLIGFGYSDKPNADYTTDFFTKFLHSFLKDLGIENPTIMGSSLGGHIAVEYAYSYKSGLDKLVLVSPAGTMKQSTPALDAYVMAALYPDQEITKNAFKMMTGGAEVSPHIIENFIARMKLPNAKFAFMSTLLGIKNAPELATRLGVITAPTLVVWGEKDPVIPVKYAEQFVKSIRDCRFYQMPNCGHTPFVEDPENFIKIVSEFLVEK